MASKESKQHDQTQQEPVFVIPPKTSRAIAIKSTPTPTNQRVPKSDADKPPLRTQDEIPSLAQKSPTSLKKAKSPKTRVAIPRMPATRRQQPATGALQVYPKPRPVPGLQYYESSSPNVQRSTRFPPIFHPYSNPQMSTMMPGMIPGVQRVNSLPNAAMQHNMMVTLPIVASAMPNQPPPSAPFQLDIHAQSYIPLWLKAVNDSHATAVSCEPLPSINYDSYFREFAGVRAISPIGEVPLPIIRRTRGVKYTSSAQLHRVSYHDFFYECLQNEIAEQADGFSRLAKFNLTYEKISTSTYCYRIKISGLRDHSPKIDLGDIVLFRRLLTIGNLPDAARRWYAPGGGRDRCHPAPGFSGQEYHAVVYGLVRAKEEIILRIDGLDSSRGTCNLKFIIQEHRVYPLCKSVSCIAEELRDWSQQEAKTDWIGSMLFPEPKDAVIQTMLPKGPFDLRLFDKELNYEQKKAVDAIIKNEYGTVPYLIQGPPGTGKTKTLVESILQLLNNPPDNVTPHLLICAPSDSAADTITARLTTYLKQSELFRLNSWTRASSEVHGAILPFCFLQDATGSSGALFSIPDFPTMMNYKVVVTTCFDASMLVQARLTNHDLSELALGLLSKISPSSVNHINPTIHWTALLIDEAAQATEPETLVPLSVVSTSCANTNPSEDVKPFMPQFVMVGDECQLGPHLFLNSTPLSVSLFERLFGRSFYQNHPLSRIHGSKPLTETRLPLPRPAFTNLIRNYRSHSAILATPSILFYADTLIPGVSIRSIVTEKFPHWRHPNRWPLCFIQASSEDTQEDILSTSSSSSGLYNRGEATAALNLVKSLLEARDAHVGKEFSNKGEILHPADIAVISPFRAQVKHLRERFRSKNLETVNIGPLEAFQGLESRVVILCTTRTRLGHPSDPNGGFARFVKEDIASNRGIVGQKQKFNVAMTRAREGLFVIGDERALTCTGDECWTQFLSFVGRNGAVLFEDAPGRKEQFLDQLRGWDGRRGRIEAALCLGAEDALRGANAGAGEF